MFHCTYLCNGISLIFLVKLVMFNTYGFIIYTSPHSIPQGLCLILLYAMQFFCTFFYFYTFVHVSNLPNNIFVNNKNKVSQSLAHNNEFYCYSS